MTENSALRAGALLFAALYAVSTFVPTLPEGAYPDHRVLALVNDDGNRILIIVGGYALAVAGLVFVWWATVLSTRVDAGSGSSLGRLGQAGGIGYGLLLMVSSTSFSGVALGIAVGELPPADDPYLVRLLSDQGFGLLLVPGLMCAALAMAACSIGLRRTGAVPAWAANTGVAFAPLLLLGFAWVPQFLVPLWALIVAFSLRSDARQSEPESIGRRATVVS